MPENSQSARHRLPGRPATTVTELVSSATCGLAIAGRRSAAVAVSAGLAAAMIGSPASAVGTAPSVDISPLTAAARAALASSPVVEVPAEAAWSFDLPVLVVRADPPPPPVVAPAAAAPPASRSQDRTPAAEPAAQPAADETAVPDAPPADVAAPASTNGSAILEIASRYVGVPYLYGGTTPNGFDCSGFTSYVFAQLGIALPRTSAAQRNAGTVVARADAQPGDLIWHPGHIGIYAGDNTLVDAPQPGGTVQFRAIYFSEPVFIRVG